MKVDWNSVCQQLVRSVRGASSQSAASRRLGYRGNPVREWEAGRRQATAPQLFHFVEVQGGDVHGALARFHAASASLLEGRAVDREFIAEWLQLLRGTSTIEALTERCSLSRYTISRMLKGSASQRLVDVLELVDAITGRATSLVLEFAPANEISALALEYSKERFRELLATEPWIHAFFRLMETEAYARLPRHQDGWVAKRLGITLDEEQAILSRLRDADIIEETDSGQLIPHWPNFTYQGSRHDEAIRNKRHYTRVVEKRLGEGLHVGDLVVSNVISVSAEDYRRVRNILEKAVRDISEVCRATPQEQVAAVVGVNLMAFEEAP